MREFDGKTVFVTGASSGIGRACVERFAAAGARILMCARRMDRLKGLANTLEKAHGTVSLAFELDVRDRRKVGNALESLPAEWKTIDVLVNNAGLARGYSKLHEGSMDDWDEMIDTNVKGLLYVTRTVVPWMVERGMGDIVNIGSIAGHEIYPNGNVYCATKAAVDAVTKGLRMDLLGTPIRVMTVDPGMVETEFSLVRFHGDTERAGTVYSGVEPLTPEDIADAVFYAASRPPHVMIAEIIMYPTAQRAATMTYREPQR